MKTELTNLSAVVLPGMEVGDVSLISTNVVPTRVNMAVNVQICSEHTSVTVNRASRVSTVKPTSTTVNLTLVEDKARLVLISSTTTNVFVSYRQQGGTASQDWTHAHLTSKFKFCPLLMKKFSKCRLSAFF